MKEGIVLEPELLKLWGQLNQLHIQLRDYTMHQYKRINPFCEDLFDWQEKGHYCSGKESVTIYDSATIVGDVKIGENTWIGPFCTIDGNRASVKIGSFCSISGFVQILTHDTVKWALSGGRLPYEYAPVEIGDCCFIGIQSIILKGVTIGNHCLVAANSVVIRDLPDYAIVAGNPARIIGRVTISESSVNLEYDR